MPASTCLLPASTCLCLLFHTFPLTLVHLSINSVFSVHDVNSISISTVLRAIKVIQV